MTIKELPAPLVVIAMVNGMIGGVILVLPLLAKEAGSISTLIVLPLSGLFSYYSCYLCIKHLDYALLKHFDGSKAVKIFYDFIVFLNFLFLLIQYFELIVQQWEGLITDNALIQIINGIVLLCLVFLLKYFDLGSSILAYGIISIIGYSIFLIWLLASAPSGSNQMPKFGNPINLASSMGQAFAIQSFFIPVIKKNPNVNNYLKYTAIAYLIGTAAYMYIAYMGSFGILNRVAQFPIPQTVQDYFPHGYWEVNVLQAIYLIHLYSVFPQFLLISKKRFFNTFGYKGSSQNQVPYPQMIYAVIFIAVCMVLTIIGVNIDIIIQVNGAVIGFFFIYFLPLIMHLKCIYFKKKDVAFYQVKPQEQTPRKSGVKEIQIPRSNYGSNLLQKPQKQQSMIQSHSSVNKQQLNRSISVSQGGKNDLDRPVSYVSQSIVEKSCDAQKGSLSYQIFDWVMLTGMMLIGTFIMIDGVYSIFA